MPVGGFGEVRRHALKKISDSLHENVRELKNILHADKNFDVLKVFKKQIEPGIILCMSDELIPYSRNAWFCPVSLLVAPR